jgi:competence protein ComEA
MKTALYIVIGILAGVLITALVWLAATPPRGEAIKLSSPPTQRPILVHVTGAVASPGLYYIPEDSRVNDAILAAGGFLDTADTSFINLAGLVKDGDKIHVPELMPGLSIGGSGLLVNINSATQAELENLPGIGPTLAKRIVDYRNQYGFFDTVDSLKDVPGIGEAVFEQIQDLITVGP